ncbi:type II toxin-antitoxin system RelE/ParE family toxin, partial [Nostoc sp. CALU 546]|uniref:type II toxin-antitoxin system RelE/ParE family toxin n=1 Tax=Nostoc sp. CALU 546 TaxID=1867241 RepID=UPI003B67D5AF
KRKIYDIWQIIYWLIGNTDAAVKFLNAAELTFAQLSKTPGMGKVTRLVESRLGKIRQWRIKDFRDYLIFYSFEDTTIEMRAGISWIKRFSRCT